MFRLIACLLAFVTVASLAADAEAQIRRRRNDNGVDVRAARGANVVVNQSLGGGGGAAQSAAIGGGFRGGVAGANVGFGHGGFRTQSFGVRGFGHHHHGGGAAAFFVPQQHIQSFPVFFAPQQLHFQGLAAPACPIGASAFGGFGASAFAY